MIWEEQLLLCQYQKGITKSLLNKECLDQIHSRSQQYDVVYYKPILSKLGLEVTPNSPQERFRGFLKIPNRYIL